MEKLYLVVREDLPPGLVASQAVHAAREFAAAHPELEAEWFRSSNTIAILGVPDEAALEALWRRAVAEGILGARCIEPDLGGSLTGLALGHSAKRILRGLQAAFKERRAA